MSCLFLNRSMFANGSDIFMFKSSKAALNGSRCSVERENSMDSTIRKWKAALYPSMEDVLCGSNLRRSLETEAGSYSSARNRTHA